MVHFQLTSAAHLGSHIDEYYYSACAVRGLSTGAVPVAGCHDNKGPLVYLLYEGIFALAGAYNYVAVKLVAYLLALLDIGLLALIAMRSAGNAAAAITAGLLLLCLSTDIADIALRTDLVGSLFLSLTLLALSVPKAFRSLARLAPGGLALGLAMVTKQNFAFAGLAVIVWLLLCDPVRSWPQARLFLLRAAVFGICALLPFAAFWLVFQGRGEGDEFLAGFFLYPMVYSAAHGNPLANFLRHAGGLLAGLMDQVLLVALAAGSAASVLRAEGEPASPGRFADPRWLAMLVTGFMLLGLTALPYWLPYYVVTVAGPMALLAGIGLAQSLPAPSRGARAAWAAILCGAVIFAAQTWRSNAKNDSDTMPPRGLSPVHAAADSRYAYELGQQPDFYAEGGFVPASGIQFSWALPGTPDDWSYSRPRAGTMVRRWLDRAQATNLTRLYRDFARTPPRYILLDSDFVRAAHSPRAADIPGFQAYLDRNCRLAARAAPRPPAELSLYACRDPR